MFSNQFSSHRSVNTVRQQ